MSVMVQNEWKVAGKAGLNSLMEPLADRSARGSKLVRQHLPLPAILLKACLTFLFSVPTQSESDW